MMSKVRSLALIAVCGAFSLVSLNAQAVAPAKVGIVNIQKALQDTQEIKAKEAELQAKYKPRQDEIQKIQSDLASIQQQLNSGKLDPARSEQLQNEGKSKQRDLQYDMDNLQADATADRQAVLRHAGEKMSGIVKTIAEQKGLDVVFDVSNTMYYKPALDITSEVTAAYDKSK